METSGYGERLYRLSLPRVIASVHVRAVDTGKIDGDGMRNRREHPASTSGISCI